MSKGRGKKIAIKFTKDLIGDVSGKGTPTPYSFYRWYITSTWSSSGRLYLYELEFFSNGVKVDTNKIVSMAGSSRYSSSYDVDRLFDGSVPGREWDANGSLPHWVSIELDEAIVIDSFRWHTGTSGNKPKEFILQGSNDGINWVDIHMDESPNLNNWIDFVVAGVGNEIAFTVTGMERNPLFYGEPALREYAVEKVERYPGTDDTILLTMTEAGRFNNVEGDITVAYDQTVGNLSGIRAVESFEVSFTPEDLEPSPVDEHIITVRGEPVVDFIKVTYEPGYEAHTVTVTGTGVFVDFIHVDDIPP